MREMKFRCWHGGDSSSCGKQMIPPQMIYGGDPGNCFVWFKNQNIVSVMQFTGLKDKCGKEIYEGDIVLIGDTWTERILDDGTGPTEDFNHLAVVTFKHGAFGCDIKENGNYLKRGFVSFVMLTYELGDDEFEVVGNIFENKELLG